MTFEIDSDALARLAVAPPEQYAIGDEFKRGAVISSGTISSTTVLDRDLLPAETRLAIRLSLLSFEEDWNAPGMEAYDEL